MSREPFQYAVLRVVPELERGEFVNVGVVVFCRTLRFLGARVAPELSRVRMLAPGADLDGIPERLDAITRIAAGDPAGGPIARLPPSERFGWIVAPSSTAIQASPTHTGLCTDGQECLERLYRTLVELPAATRD
jgi:hypothetical protein